MRICYFGTYTMEEGYPRNRVIIEGLRKNGVDVIECHAELWKGTSEKLEGIKDGFSVFKQSARILRAYLKLINQYRRVGNYDALIVGYAGHVDIFLAKILNLFRKKPLIFDAFLSLYDTAVMDRKIVSQNSLKAKLLWWVDRWSCKMADAVLLDTPAHVDYFVREFRLPAEKFHAIPVGSYLAPPESCHIPLSQETGDYSGDTILNSLPTFPLRRIKYGVPGTIGTIGDFTVLYFGSYIPLHGVDVIIKAAKIIQDKGSGLPSVIPAEAGIQNAGRGLDSHFRGNDENTLPFKGRDRVGMGFSGGSEVVFTLVGTGQLLPAMKELALRLELKNIIFIDRFVSEEELMGYIMEADICLGVFGQTDKAARVIPCKVYNCLAMGKPLISMLSPAIEGVLTHMDNALLCKPGDAQDLAKAILVLKKDVSLRAQIANCGQEFFRKNFSVEAIGEKVVDILNLNNA